jgi:hypothetical protein
MSDSPLVGTVERLLEPGRRVGFIRTPTGQRYRFRQCDVVGAMPRRFARVTFEPMPGADARRLAARRVQVITDAASTERQEA